ncbi:FecR domain-containing protein [Compostibacter hankyongensis]|uniref:DUF4974 domain-containing protein n=1 Tax=Compostibacter hankyongensis TaxID=1007089 RepID=A0ABP8G365_9BACT
MADLGDMRAPLLKYIAGEADEEETIKVEQWLAETPEHFKEFERLWDLWYAVGTATNVYRFDVDRAWKAVSENQDVAAQKKTRFVSRPMIGIGIAAAVLAILFAAIGWWRNDHGRPGFAAGGKATAEDAAALHDRPEKNGLKNTDTKVDLKTRPGERERRTLPDGSVAWLNGNTSVSFCSSASGKRIVYLTGEAFFDVKQSAEHPFIVKTAYATISVLGTRFNVTAYGNDSLTEAVLTRGAIAFNVRVNNHEMSRKIEPGEKVSINRISDQLKVISVDTSFYSSWTEGVLVFRSEAFGQVARAMERKYNVSFIFLDKSLVAKRLSGYFDRETLKEALDALQLTLPFRYRIHDREVVISQDSEMSP